jgi:biotin carboxyl carrier protein
MTDRDDDLQQVQRAASDLIPKLTERLARHGLGELEVREGSLRVRVAGAPVPAAAPQPEAGLRVIGTTTPAQASPAPASPVPTATNQGVSSPAVGFFVYAEGLGPGLAVEKGDELGYVEMLGVRHDVRAPRRGTVRNLVTEAGDPVEYAQLLIELEPAE